MRDTNTVATPVACRLSPAACRLGLIYSRAPPVEKSSSSSFFNFQPIHVDLRPLRYSFNCNLFYEAIGREHGYINFSRRLFKTRFFLFFATRRRFLSPRRVASMLRRNTTAAASATIYTQKSIGRIKQFYLGTSQYTYSRYVIRRIRHPRRITTYLCTIHISLKFAFSSDIGIFSLFPRVQLSSKQEPSGRQTVIKLKEKANQSRICQYYEKSPLVSLNCFTWRI